MSDKPPFIASQRILLLTETDSPRLYLQPSFFRSQRPGASGPTADGGVDSSAWTEIERDQFLGVQPIEGCDLRRAVLTTDAGIGKTANLEWLHSQINAAGDGRLALLVPINELAASYDQFLPETLVKCFRYAVAGNSAEHLTQDDAELILRRLRDAGQIVLLLDALDQTGAASPQIETLSQIIAHPDWRRCRIVISGRPHALVLHWDRLLEARSVGWRYLQLAEFDAAQQQQYLGQTAGGRPRYESIRHEARDILGTPRVLQYLRKLTDGELAQIRTPSDVYLKSLRHLIVEGMSKDETARKIGLPADSAAAPAKVQSYQVDRALKLLAGIAFEMTKWPAPPGAENLPDVQVAVPRPNFDQIAPGDFNGFRDCICGRLPEASTAADLDRLAALNGILQHGFFDSGDSEGLRQILWRNRSVQEFCAAYWLSQFCTLPDVETLDRRLDLRSDHPAP